MRIVLDTNVFVSAGLKAASTPAVAVQLAVNHGQLLKSPATEEEVMRVLGRPKIAALIDPLFAQWVARSMAAAEHVTVRERLAICRDPKDDIFLELAVNGKADLVVSGDADLIAMSPFREIPIVPPGLFVSARRT